MQHFHSVSILVSIAAFCAWCNHRFIKLPAAIGVMAVSLILSIGSIFLGRVGLVDTTRVADFVNSFNFHDLVLHAMLGLLLFAGGMSVNLQELKTQKGVVMALSSLGVVIGATITGSVFWLGAKLIGLELPFVFALLLGAIVSPTDAVAILGIMRKVGVPRSLELKLVGESLFNDGIGVVVFLAVSSLAFGGGMGVGDVVTTLFVEVVGGAALGLGLGWAAYQVIKSVDQYVVEILVTLALAMGGYSLAEAVHVSAPICVVVAGLIIGNQGRELAMSHDTREHLDTFWELVDELLNVVLFVLVGLEVLILNLSGQQLLAGLVAVCAMLISRFISVGSTITIMRQFRDFSPHVVKILTWGGLRGGISVALALSLPDSETRDLLVVCTYVAVLFSVLVQGVTLPALLRYATKTEQAPCKTH
jgi:CPA1 family monovalent cation:H+ antiporter